MILRQIYFPFPAASALVADVGVSPGGTTKGHCYLSCWAEDDASRCLPPRTSNRLAQAMRRPGTHYFDSVQYGRKHGGGGGSPWAQQVGGKRYN